MKRTLSNKRTLPAALLAAALPAIVLAQATQNTTYQYKYDAQGNLTQIIDPRGLVKDQVYDHLNRMKQQLQPAPTTGAARPLIQYGYDGLGQISSVTDPRALVTNYTIDGLGNQTGLASPDTGNSTRTYDAVGNLKTITDARGSTTTYSYDALNRITGITRSPDAAVTFTYDGSGDGQDFAVGRLTEMDDANGITFLQYDDHGRLFVKTQYNLMTVVNGKRTGTRPPSAGSVSYDYGAPNSGPATGKVTVLYYPSGNTVNYSYDAGGRITALTLTDLNGVTTPLLSGIGYASFGAAQSWTWGNSTATGVNTYAKGLDLDGRTTSYPLGNLLRNGVIRTVSYDAASRVQNLNHSGNATAVNLNQSFGYDNLDRLTGFTAAATGQSYQYDVNGNRTQLTVGGTSYGNTIATGSNRLTATSGPVPAKTNSYDAMGNLLSDGTVTYTYDVAGRLSSAKQGTQTVYYLYNGLGQRVQKTGPTALVPTGINYFVYDEQGHLLGDYDINMYPQQETIWLGDTPVAVLKQTVTGTAPNQTTSTQVYYVYADHLNTPRVITRASDNKMVWRWDNADPFGSSRPDENPSGLGAFMYNLRFAGQYFDKETNLFYNINRDYDPSTGRYIQSDPIGLAGGINTYAYVRGNPLRYVDPLGLYTEVVIWNGVGKGESQFGHVSTNLNGQNWSWGPSGWDTQYPSAADYAARQQSFRGGTGYILDLTPLEEAKVAACLQAHSGKYNFIKNNCTTPPQECLPPRFNTGGSWTPNGLGQDLGNSPGLIGTKTYQGPERTGAPFDNPALWGF